MEIRQQETIRGIAKEKKRTRMNDSPYTVMKSLAREAPGAIQILISVYTYIKFMQLGGMNCLKIMDQIRLYDYDIVIFYNYIAQEDILKFMLLIKAVELGFLSDCKIHDGIEKIKSKQYHEIPCQKIYTEMKKYYKQKGKELCV